MADEDSSSGGTVRQRVVLELFSPQPTNLAGLQTGLKMLGAMEAQMRNIETRWNRMFSGAAGGAALGGLQAAAKGVTGQLTSAVTQSNVLSQKFDKLRKENQLAERVTKLGPGVTVREKFGTAAGQYGVTSQIEEQNYQRRNKAAQAQANAYVADKRRLAEEMAAGRERQREERRHQQIRPVQFQQRVQARDDRVAREAEKAAQALAKQAEAHRYLGRNMLENIGKVTAWTSSVAVLYGAVNLARNSLETLITTGFQQARLTQVFKGTAYEAGRLTDDILRLASANGRSASEAMESAIQWSRLGLNRVQVNEAVRVSLMAANVAEISAAQATEHLASLTAVYGLRAAQLNSVLGMLNNTSNTYNVTNREMLEGLTRTAAVAKQAGIPLAELIGLLGAGVGATGQSGANIGNALKSFMGSVSSGDKLRVLREQFGFEGTDASGELKNMSELLSELFIKYNQMSQAEQRLMLFSVAGKHQASRMAAILDNYVKAQVLAINAQLNLNSAEEENARIKATLQSQLKGLTAEWARFVNAQGNRGVAQGLSEITKGMTNVLRVANAPGLNLFTTALTALGVGLAAKLALTGVQMSKVGERGNYVRNTLVGIKHAAHDVGLAWSAMMARGSFVGRKLGAKPGSIFGAAIPESEMRGRSFSAADSGRFVQGEDGRLMRLKMAADGASMALVSAGRGAKFARASFMALTDVILPLLAVYAVIKLLNAGAEAMGLSSDKMEDDVGRLQASAERSRSAAEAHQMRERMIRQTQKLFSDPTVTAARRDSLAGQIGEAFAPYESGDTAAEVKRKKQLQAEYVSELRLIGRIGDETERTAKSSAFFDRQAGEAMAARSRKRAQEVEDSLRASARLQAEIEKLERSPFNRQEKIKELKQRQEEQGNRRISSYLEDTKDNSADADAFRERDRGFKVFAQTQKAMVSDLVELWNQLPGDSHVDKINKQIAAQELLDRVLSSELKTLDALVTAEARRASGTGVLDPGWVAIKEKSLIFRKVQLEQEMADLREGELQSGEGASYGPTSIAFEQRRGELQAKSAQLNADAAALRNEQEALNKQQSDSGYKRAVQTAEQTRQEKEANAVALEANRKRIEMQAIADRRDVALRFGAARIAGYGTGADEGERTVNRIEGLRQAIIPQGSAENMKLQAMQHSVELQNELLKGELRLVELHAQEKNLIAEKNREFQRGLLLAGPAELLRKLAIAQAGKGGMNAGSFFAFDAGARQNILELPENSREVQDNRRTQKGLRGAGLGNKTLEQIQAEYVAASRDRAVMYKDLVPPEINEAARMVVGQFKSLETATANLVTKFQQLVLAMPQTLTSQPPGVPQAGNYNPRMSLAG